MFGLACVLWLPCQGPEIKSRYNHPPNISLARHTRFQTLVAHLHHSMPVFQTYRRVLVKKISESTCLKTSRRDNVHSQLRAFFAKGGSCGVRTRHLKVIESLGIRHLSSQKFAFINQDQPVYPRRRFNTAEREWFLERELPETYSEDQERHRPHMKPRYDWRKRAYSRKIRDRGRDPNLSEEFRYVARVRPNDKQGCRLSSANMGYSEVLAKRDYLKKLLFSL